MNFSIIGISHWQWVFTEPRRQWCRHFNKVADELRLLGCKVELYAEKEFVACGAKADVIFDMARDRATIARLKSLEDEGALVVNSTYGIDNCVRRPMTELLIQHGVPHPRSFVISTDRQFEEDYYPCWIKRGDSHAMVKKMYAIPPAKKRWSVFLADFRSRHIPVAVINEHLQGDLIKFYGVQGTVSFIGFILLLVRTANSVWRKSMAWPKEFPLMKKNLRNIAIWQPEVLNVPIYGGDCVVSTDGELKIIDFNDWPSFARCREEAGVRLQSAFITRWKKKQMKK